MISTQYYPSLSSVINLDALPDQLGFIEGGLDQLLADIYVKEFQFTKNRKGDSIAYYFILKIYKRLSIEIPGAFTLLLNPPSSSDPDPYSSEIPCSFQFELDILRYTHNFSLEHFSHEPKAFFQLILDILDITENELLDLLISGFTETDGINEIIANINEANDLIGTADEIPYSFTGTREQQIDDLITAIETLSSGTSVIDIVYSILDSGDSIDFKFGNINQLFSKKFSEKPIDRIKKMLIPRISGFITLRPAIEFPRNVLVPVNPAGDVEEDENIKTRLYFDVGDFLYSTDGYTGFSEDISVSFDPLYPTAQLGNTGFTFGFTNAKLDISRDRNIPEATADGRPDNFVGVFAETVTVNLPKKWFKAPPSSPPPPVSTAQLIGKNLLVGTGGISGKITFDTNGFVYKNIGKFGFYLDQCDVTFQQNSIIESNIEGRIKITGFEDSSGNPAIVQVKVHIAENGDFNITAKEAAGIPIRIPNVLELDIKTLTFGREDDRFYVETSGTIKILNSVFNKIFKGEMEIEKFRIWDDGSIEIAGGGIELKKAVTFELGPAKLSITGLHVGSHERYHNGVLRKYRYLGFDGGVKIDPGGVEASGKGIKFYFTVDNATLADLHVYLKLQSLTVDLILPGNKDPKEAKVLIHGYLAMIDNPSNPDEASEYIGGVDFAINLTKDKSISGSAAMRYNPELPSFIVDASLTLPKAIPVTPSLGIYGFRGLVGQRFVADRDYVANHSPAPVPAVTDITDWYQFYKAKVDPRNKEGIGVEKFAPRAGFSFGAGVSLATTADSGKAFSSKLFFLLSLPEAFLLEGQAAILRKRIDLDPTNDEPPFSALIAIDPSGIRGGIGVNYKIPEDSGDIVAVNGKMDLNFPFHGPGWYVNIGKDQPVSERIAARVCNLFDVTAYLMISAAGIRMGAGAYWDFRLDVKVLKIHAYLQAEVSSRISFKPLQLGGAIAVAGGVDVTVFGFNFGLSLSMGLGAEAPKPFMLHGEAEICVHVLKKDHCASITFSWVFNSTTDTSPLTTQLLNTDTEPTTEAHQEGIKAVNMLTGETFPIYFQTGTVTTLPDLTNYIVPLDATIDFEFKKPIGPATSLTSIGGNTMGLTNYEYVPPQKGLSSQVYHNYHVENVQIFYHDGTTWQPYDIYTSLIHPGDASILQTSNYSDLKIGYWQYEEPNKLNKLSILSNNPFQYLTSGVGLDLEDTGLSASDIFCGDDPIDPTCFNFDLAIFNFREPLTTLNYDRLYSWNGLGMRITHTPPSSVPLRLLNIPNVFGITKSLELHPGDTLELFFSEPMAQVTLHLGTMATAVRIRYYQKEQTGTTSGGVPVYGYTLLQDNYVQQLALMLPVEYDNRDMPVDKVEIVPQECKQQGETSLGQYEAQQCIAVQLLLKKLNRKLDKLWKNYFAYEKRCKALQGKQEADYWCHLAQETLDQINAIQDEIDLLNQFIDNYCSCNMLQENTGEMLRENRGNLLVDRRGVIGATQSDSKGDTVTLSCSTFFFEVCSLPVSAYDFNASIPSFTDLSNEQAALQKALSQVIQPIWRPFTSYSIRMTVSDTVNSGSADTQDYTIFFRTVGPIGHFHSHMKSTAYVSETTDVENFTAYYDPTADTYADDRKKLTGLKHYIDYAKSYPNADGDLLNAKPLFYVNAKLRLFFLKPYIYTMYGDFADLVDNTVTRMTSSLGVDIIDPVDPQTDDLGSIIGTIASAALSFHANSNPHMEPDVELYNNLTASADNCVGADPVTPIGINTEADLSDLKPLKLYTAVYSSTFKRFNADGTPFDTNARKAEVHRHVFRTSRYASFEEQVNSYILAVDPLDSSIITAEAVFQVSDNFYPGLSTALQVVNGTMSSSDPLLQQFALPYDRLITGALNMKAMDSAETTEFNFLRDSGSGNRIIGILVRNPEPFNDPKTPASTLATTLTVSRNGGPTGAFKVIFSKDTSCAFITNPSMHILPGIFTFTFRYMLFDGSTYAQEDIRTVQIDASAF